MFEAEKKPLDFVIDKLTNSIENTITAEVFDTLIVNQETLFATHFRGLRMYIETKAAMKLVNHYFKNY
jgi:hypothetical protein